MNTDAINNSITEDYCSFEVSKLLKEKGFNGRCNYTINSSTHGRHRNDIGELNSDKHSYISCPTHALAIKWIRENFRYDIWADRVSLISFCYGIGLNGNYSNKIKSEEHFASYEDAISSALFYTLKNLIPMTDKELSPIDRSSPNYYHNLFMKNADVWTDEQDWTMRIDRFKELLATEQAYWQSKQEAGKGDAYGEFPGYGQQEAGYVQPADIKKYFRDKGKGIYDNIGWTGHFNVTAKDILDFMIDMGTPTPAPSIDNK